MIGYLKGIPKLIGTQFIIDVHGVGYLVNVGIGTLGRVQQRESVELYIHTHVREDSLSLYGFLSLADQQLFEKMLDVSGVGPKTALQIADRGVEQITQAVQNADTSFFTSIPRVGKKVGQKIIIELRSKLGSLKELDLKPESQQYTDVVAALENLGYGTNEIFRALQEINVEELTLQAAIKLAMKKIAQS